MNKKILIGNIIAVVILGLTSIPIGVSNEGKPDLVVKRIYPYSSDAPVPIGMVCKIKNKGDSPASGELYLQLIVTRLLFGIVPIPISNSYKNITLNGLNPGKKREVFFNGANPDLPGFYRFICIVNLYKIIDESNYINNIHRPRYLITDPENAISGWWGLG